MKKRLIAIMAAAFMTTATMTGCARESVDENFMGDPHINNGYIIIEQNDKDVLHKGKYFRDDNGSSHAFQFDCGENFYSNVDASAYFKRPKADRYDEICEDCFSK